MLCSVVYLSRCTEPTCYTLSWSVAFCLCYLPLLIHHTGYVRSRVKRCSTLNKWRDGGRNWYREHLSARGSPALLALRQQAMLWLNSDSCGSLTIYLRVSLLNWSYLKYFKKLGWDFSPVEALLNPGFIHTVSKEIHNLFFFSCHCLHEESNIFAAKFLLMCKQYIQARTLDFYFGSNPNFPQCIIS